MQRHDPVSCRACGYRFDSVSQSGDVCRVPSDGDFSVCFRCGEVSVFVVGPLGIGVREPTLAELAEFSADREATRTVQSIHEFWARRGEG